MQISGFIVLCLYYFLLRNPPKFWKVSSLLPLPTEGVLHSFIKQLCKITDVLHGTSVVSHDPTAERGGFFFPIEHNYSRRLFQMSVM